MINVKLLISMMALGSLLIGACSGGGTASPNSATSTASPNTHELTQSADVYAAAICNSSNSWYYEVHQDLRKEKKALSHGITPSQGRSIDRSLLDHMVSSTEEMISAIKTAGIPEVPHGSAVASRIVSGLEASQTALRSDRNDVDRLPTERFLRLLISPRCDRRPRRGP